MVRRNARRCLVVTGDKGKCGIVAAIQRWGNQCESQIVDQFEIRFLGVSRFPMTKRVSLGWWMGVVPEAIAYWHYAYQRVPHPTERYRMLDDHGLLEGIGRELDSSMKSIRHTSETLVIKR